MNSNQQKDEDFFIGVTASWCGACHNISDRLNKALKHAKRPGSRIDDTLMDTFNKSMNSSIQPPHFPYFIVIDTDGNIKQTLNNIDEVEEFLAKRDANQSSPKTAKTANQIMNENEAEEEEAEEEAEELEESMLGTNAVEEPEEITMEMESVKNLPPVVGKVNSMPKNNNNSGASFKSGSAKTNTGLPPNAAELDVITQSNVRKPVNSMEGGCLYASLATTAYQLAPPAVLLGIAAATLKKRGKKTQKNRRR